jgi:hypothetical protein
MKRWLVDLKGGQVELAMLQDTRRLTPEYATACRYFVFVLAVDELGAFVRATQLVAEAKP